MPIDKRTVIFIVGPTGIGKTGLAVKLAKRIKGEIVSCDSMQVYKGMDILSQSPRPSKTKKICYHLIRFLDPAKEYSAGAFIKSAASLIDDILIRKKFPMVVGGTGLYMKSLIDGLFPTPKADLKFREEMYDYASRYGNKRLHKKLEKIDPVSAKAIHPNNIRRVVRALEICHTTGKTIAQLRGGTKGIADKYRIKIFGLTSSRENIYSRINDRVDGMFEEGLVKEVKRLSKKRPGKTARAALGYREALKFLKGETDLETAKDAMKQNTRRYAKRQLTWFRADGRIKWFDVDKMNNGRIINAITKEIK